MKNKMLHNAKLDMTAEVTTRTVKVDTKTSFKLNIHLALNFDCD